MESDEEIAASAYDGGWITAEPAPSLDKTLEQMRQDLAAWCIARPDPSALSIGPVYEELACLDAKQKSLLPDEDLDEHCGWHSQRKPAALVLRDAKPNEVSRGVAVRRHLLRSRALELSHGGLRPLTREDGTSVWTPWRVLFSLEASGGDVLGAEQGPDTDSELDTDDEAELLALGIDPGFQRLFAATEKYVEDVLDCNPLRDTMGV